MIYLITETEKSSGQILKNNFDNPIDMSNGSNDINEYMDWINQGNSASVIGECCGNN